MQITNARIAAAIFVAVAAIVLFVHGQRMVMGNDEGIVLEAAQRIAEGQHPYTDFFGYMSPGSYWLQAAVYRVAGVSLTTGRLITVLDFALQCALMFWLTAHLSSRRAATAAALAFAGFQGADPAFLTSTHRWDSATFALGALCLAVRGKHWIACGALLGAAVWCTPSMGLVALVVFAFLVCSRELRPGLAPFLAGIAAIGLLGIAALAFTGSLAGFFRQMAWLSENYARINVMPYGSVVGGWPALFEGTSGVETAVAGLLAACIALPAILPVTSLLLWASALWKDSQDRRTVILLLASMAALVITTLPRSDVMHLAFIAALPYALTVAGIARIVPARAASFVAMGAVLLATLFATNHFRGRFGSPEVASAAGPLHVPEKDAAALANLTAAVHPGDGLFVYPYMPLFYTITQGRNPTRFSYLAPGMMTPQEEREALGQLHEKPPEWIIYLRAAPEDFARVFPKSAGINWRFEHLEQWVEENYLPVDPPAGWSGYRLWRRAEDGIKDAAVALRWNRDVRDNERGAPPSGVH